MHVCIIQEDLIDSPPYHAYRYFESVDAKYTKITHVLYIVEASFSDNQRKVLHSLGTAFAFLLLVQTRNVTDNDLANNAFSY